MSGGPGGAGDLSSLALALPPGFAVSVAAYSNVQTIPSNETMFGKRDGPNGALRMSEFKAKMKYVFAFNTQIPCIYKVANTSTAAAHFFDELYLSYLLLYGTQIQRYNGPGEFNNVVFDASTHNLNFKQFILAPNLTGDGPRGFPRDLGVNPELVETWLKM